MASAKHWRRPGDLERVKVLAVLYRDFIAWDYVAMQAARYDVEDMLANLRRALDRAQRLRGGGHAAGRRWGRR